MQMSGGKSQPRGLFDNEVSIQARHDREILKSFAALVAEKSRSSSVDRGRENCPVEPYHLIFAIWAVTQHYADFFRAG